MGFRILVVEDDPVSREIVATLLAGRGYEIETAEDGFNALRVAQERVFDLVLIDYHLPEMDGYALARLMRSLGEKSNPGMKMIAITADQFGLAARRGVDTVFDGVMAKPIDPSTFPGLVADALGAGSALEELEGFLGGTPASTEVTAAPSLALWRTRGLDHVPAVRVFPAPSRSDRAKLEHCFRIVDDASKVDCLVLLREAGMAEVEAIRRAGPHYLLPLVSVEAASALIADAFFEPGDGDTWTSVAQTIANFTARRATVHVDFVDPAALDMRLLAFMYVADRQLELRRGADGHTIIPKSSGFRHGDIVAGVKSLLGKDLVTTTIDKAAQILKVKLKPDARSDNGSQHTGVVGR